MSSGLSTYSQRVAKIIDIVDPYLRVRQHILDTSDPNPFERRNGLSCRWFDKRTHMPMGSVTVSESDTDTLLADLRAQVSGAEYYEPGMATEVTGLNDGEYVYLQHYGPSVTALVGPCQVVLVPPRDHKDLEELVAPILAIAHTVGCSAYLDDSAGSAPAPAEGDRRWGVGPGLPDYPAMPTD